MDGKDRKSSIAEYISSILVPVGLALVIRTGVVQAFYIPSGSMEDSLLVGDYLLANKFVYGAPIDVPGTNISLFRLPAIRDPEPGDIVIFRSPVDPDRDLIKRCVAVGGEDRRRPSLGEGVPGRLRRGHRLGISRELGRGEARADRDRDGPGWHRHQRRSGV